MDPESRAGFLLANRLLSLLIEGKALPADKVVAMLRDLAREATKSGRYVDKHLSELFDKKADEIMAKTPDVDFDQ